MPVRYPAACIQVASVLVSSRAVTPPLGGALLRTPWLWEYWPVRKVAREGAQSALVTNEFVNVTPWPTMADWMLGRSPSDSMRAKARESRSSTRITTTFGRRADWASTRAPRPPGTPAAVKRPRADATAKMIARRARLMFDASVMVPRSE